MLIDGLIQIESNEKLFQLTLSDYPRMENKDRNEWHKHFKKLSGIKEKIYTNKESIQKLQGN